MYFSEKLPGAYHETGAMAARFKPPTFRAQLAGIPTTIQTTRIVGCPYGEAARAFRETRCSGCEIRTADPFGHNSLVHPDHEDGWLSFWRSCTCIWCNEVQWLAGPCTSVRPRLAPCSLVNCQLQYPAFRFQACLPCAPVILF